MPEYALSCHVFLVRYVSFNNTLGPTGLKDKELNITVIGTGYVGLVTAACFAEMGNTVTCVDNDQDKIEGLKKGLINVYEPGLSTLLTDNLVANRLFFSADIAQACKDTDVCFLAIEAPSDSEGKADASLVVDTAAQVAQHITRYCTIINKSTAPVGTSDKVVETFEQALNERGCDFGFEVVANPEFLKEGCAIDDFMRPDRIIIGVESDRARQIMTDLYKPFSRSHDKLVFMGIRDAELTKYAANAMLATRVSLMNELANLAEHLGVDIEKVRKGIGSDSRIGYSYIYPGCGYGGSCLPKDIKALVQMGKEHGFETGILKSVEERNQKQKDQLFDKIEQLLGGSVRGKIIGIWGLAFKPGTDDMSAAPSVVLIESLIRAGAIIKAYDPVAMNECRKHFPAQYFNDGIIQLTDHQYDALKDADAMVLVTEWKPFRQPDFNAIKRLFGRSVK